VASFFGYEGSQPEQESLLSDTSALAETIRAYRTMNQAEEGLALLKKIPDSFGSSHSVSQERDPSNDARWIPVVNQAIHLLSD